MRAAFAPGLLLFALGVASSDTVAQVRTRFESAATVFGEQGGGLETYVVTPLTRGTATVDDHYVLDATWEADVVSGASVALVDSPTDVDAISSATHYQDLRNVGRFAAGYRDERLRARIGYAYGTENDYRSHQLSASGGLDLLERSLQLDAAYSVSLDQVCDRSEQERVAPAQRARLSTSEGCFTSEPGTAARGVTTHAGQLAWTQAWAPFLTTQLLGSLQYVDGFQSSPYRAVWLGPYAAQEHVPSTRTRGALGLDVRLAVAPLEGFLLSYGRVYRDDWGIVSGTVELGWEQRLGAEVRARARYRHYAQTGAFFASDDYATDPRGQYFAGDRELFAFTSNTVGARLSWDLPRDGSGLVFGALEHVQVVVSADVAFRAYPFFHYGNVPVPNGTYFTTTLDLILEP